MQENKRKQQSFEYGAMILLCSTMLVKIIGAIFKIPIARLWTEDGFGCFDSAYQLFTPIYTLAMAGLPIAISRIVATHVKNGRYNDVRRTFKVAKRIFMITGFSGFVIMLLLSFPFVKYTDASGESIYSIFAIAPALFFCCIMSAYRGYYEGLRNMYPTAISDVIEALGKLILGYGFAYIVMKITGRYELSAAGAMLGIVIGGIASATFLTIRYKIKGDGITKEELLAAPPAESNKTLAKALIAIAIPVVLASLANSFSSLADTFFVKGQLTQMMGEHADTIRGMYASSIAERDMIAAEAGKAALTNEQIPNFLFGTRGKAFTLYNLVPSITSILGVSALPVITSAWTKKELNVVKQNIESTLKLTAIITMPIGFGFLSLGNEVMQLLYDTAASVEIGGIMLRIYGLAAIFAGLAIPMTSILQAIGKEKISLRNVAIGAVIKVAVNFVLVGIPSVNIRGAAVGTMACFLFIFVANLLSLIKHTGVKPNMWKTILKPLIAAFACGLSTVVLNLSSLGKMGTVIEVAVAAVVYFAVLIILNTFEAEDVTSLPKGDKILKIFRKLRIIR